MKSYNWEKNLDLLSGFNTFRDFIWQTHTVGQLKEDVANNREDFFGSISSITTMENTMGDEIEDFCDKEEALEICGGQSDQWDDVRAIQVNTAIYRSMQEFYEEHSELFDKHPDKKIMEVISCRPAEVWQNPDNDFSSHTTLEGFIRANCYGRDIIYAYHYGDTADEPPHVYESEAAKIYKQFGKAISAAVPDSEKGNKLTKAEKVNLYIQNIMDKIYKESEKDLLASPTLRLDKLATTKDQGRG